MMMLKHKPYETYSGSDNTQKGSLPPPINVVLKEDDPLLSPLFIIYVTIKLIPTN